MTTLAADGESTSGTAGTVVASLTAAAGKAFYGWTAYALQSNTANTQLRLTVTYSDSSTTTQDTVAASDHLILANQGGGVRVAGPGDAVQAWSNLPVTKLEVTTLGTGTGTRFGLLGAEELLIGDPVSLQSAGSSTASAGTIVADVQAATDRYLASWTVFAAQTQNANTSVRIVVTYADGSTTNSDTVVNTQAWMAGNAGGAVRCAGGVINNIVTFSDLKVTRVRVETLGSSSTGTRYGAVAALQERAEDGVLLSKLPLIQAINHKSPI